jgi:hypothetical protein
MAKMFYSLEETAEKLGLSTDEIKELANQGKLQQFRDRDKLMYKRDQVEAMASNGDSTANARKAQNSASGTGPSIAQDKSDGLDPISLDGDSEGSSATRDAISLAEDSSISSRTEDPRQATGVSVFDTDEVEAADPMAQTSMTNTVEDSESDLMIESVGSGSGLLDLTRESDDTSLGAELLDEIYPTSEAGSGVENQVETSSAESAIDTEAPVFEGGIGSDTGSSSGLDNLVQVPDPSTGVAAVGSGGVAPGGMVAIGAGYEDVYDPAGSWFSFFALLGATASLVIVFMLALGAIAGIPTELLKFLAASDGQNYMIVCIAMLVGSLILAGVGFFIGNMRAKAA